MEEGNYRGESGIRLLIVEDEKPIRNGLLRHVHWQELGVDRIEAAENATEALRLLAEEFTPDILLTDIRMPGMYGTKLAGIFRQKIPDCQIIFISGYSDKEYLHAAISLGAVDYVEKPIDISELEKVIRKAVAELQKSRRSKASILHALIHYPEQELVPDEESGELWHHYCVFTLHTAGAQAVDLYVIESQIEAQMRRTGFPSCGILTDKGTNVNYVILVRGGEPWPAGGQEAVCRVIQSCAGDSDLWFVAASGEWSGRSSVPAACRESADVLRHLSWKGWGSWALPAEKSTDYTGALSEEDGRYFYRLIADGKEDEAVLWVNGQYRALVEAHAQMNFSVRSLFHTMDQAIIRACLAQPGVDHAPFSTQISDDAHAAETIAQLRDLVCEHIRLAAELLKGGSKANYQIKQVCDYIHAHLGEKDLSLGRLAETVYLTPTYLSSMFSRTMGVTVGQYITEARIRKAAELLKDPQYKQYQVAEMVGYDDPKYFARLFKKKMGVSPSEYRDSL